MRGDPIDGNENIRDCKAPVSVVQLPFGASLSAHLVFCAACTVILLVFLPALYALLRLSMMDERYTHIAIVPLMTAGLLYFDKVKIMRHSEYWPKPAFALLVLAGLLFFGLARYTGLSIALAVSILAVIVSLTAAFLLCYGKRALQAARFPLLFLLLMVPLPIGLLEKISYALQVASADTAYVLFRCVGIPVYRDGFVFSLPAGTIEIAEQCSGLRSTTALFITGVLLGHFLLRSASRKLGLIVFAVLVSIFKNGVRIVVISSAKTFFGTDLLNSSLHHTYGGTVFSALALAMIVPAVLLLRRSERANPTGRSSVGRPKPDAIEIQPPAS